MLIPMIVLAGLCILFGVANGIPLGGLIQPAVGPAVTGGHNFAGFPASTLLIELTAAALLLAVLNHWYGVRKSGRGLGAADHIHNAIFLAPVYAVAEKGQMDPYTIGRWVFTGASISLYAVDRAFDWFYDTLVVKTALGISWLTRRAHNGNVNRYVMWSLAGAAVVIVSAVAVRRREMSHLLILIPFVGLIIRNALPRNARVPPAIMWIVIFGFQTVVAALQPFGIIDWSFMAPLSKLIGFSPRGG